MPWFREVGIEIDGWRYAGSWTLRPSGVIFVGCVWGADTVEIGQSDPETAAANALQRLVLADKHRRAKGAG